MHYHPKLILLNGSVGIDKTTIAQRYADEHPLTLVLHGDGIIVMLGQWIAHEQQARKLTFELTKSMVATHLHAGYNVIVPYVVTDATHAADFEELALKHRARFYEIVLYDQMSDALKERPYAISIPSTPGKADETYQRFLEIIS